MGTDNPDAFDLFRSVRDDLFANHPQSALDETQKQTFSGLHYYEYDPAYRVRAVLDPDVEEREYYFDAGNDGTAHVRQIGKVDFTLPNGRGSLGVYWLTGYGGGIFIPFGDATNKHTTYGGGRYLYDTIKGADLGIEGESLLLDFNYAYHPSCFYHPRWTCPLAPPQNRLDFAIEAGERRSH